MNAYEYTVQNAATALSFTRALKACKSTTARLMRLLPFGNRADGPPHANTRHAPIATQKPANAYALIPRDFDVEKQGHHSA